MGNAFSSVVEAQKRDEVNTVVADVMNTFLLRFLVHYKNRIVVKYAGHHDDRSTIISCVPRQLHQCPALEIPLISGVISKQRDWVKSWAERYVVVRNEADNYRIDYYLTWSLIRKEPRVLKGSIYPIGYYIESFLSDSELTSLSGTYCIKLSPLNSKKRPWYLRFKSQEEKDLWQKVLVVATQQSKSNFANQGTSRARSNELLTDLHVARAYFNAYRDVRLRYGLCGNFKITGTEVEALSELTVKIIGYEVTNNVCNSVADAVLRETVSTAVNDKVVRLVDRVVKQTWRNASAVAESMRQNTERQVKVVITPLKQQIVLLKECIMESVEMLVKNFVVEASSKLCRPLLATASGAIARAYAAVIKSMYAYVMEQFIASEDMSTETPAAASSSAGSSSGSVDPSQQAPLSEFSRFIERTHLAIDSDWMPMILIRGQSRSIVGVAVDSDMTVPARGSMSASAASLLPHRSSSLGNFNAMHTNHLLYEGKLVLDELRMYNGGFAKVAHVFSAGFSSKDAVNIIVEQMKAFCHNAVYTLDNRVNKRRPKNRASTRDVSSVFSQEVTVKAAVRPTSIMHSDFKSSPSPAAPAEGTNPRIAIFDEIMSTLMHDAVLAHFDTLTAILGNVLKPNIESHCIIPGIELIAPIREMVTAITTPGVSNCIDLEILLEAVTMNIVQSHLSELIVETAESDIREAVDSVANELLLTYNAPKLSLSRKSLEPSAAAGDMSSASMAPVTTSTK